MFECQYKYVSLCECISEILYGSVMECVHWRECTKISVLEGVCCEGRVLVYRRQSEYIRVNILKGMGWTDYDRGSVFE